MNKLLALSLAIIVLLSFAGCGAENSQVEDYAENYEATDNDQNEDNDYYEEPDASYDYDEDSSSFTNKYGTSTTKCAHSGCSNYIASSGDTNCCTSHSNKCLECSKYIDEDAMYCMSCLTEAAEDYTYDDYDYSYDDYDYSYDDYDDDYSGGTGYGGYDMPNEDDESFSDYVQRVDPELYDSLFGGTFG